jgi:hypothetical protein
VTTGEIDRLPDPDLFRDAMLLAEIGTWSPQELDDTDAILLALVRKIRTARRG